LDYLKFESENKQKNEIEKYKSVVEMNEQIKKEKIETLFDSEFQRQELKDALN
jgi:hypothetical protein